MSAVFGLGGARSEEGVIQLRGYGPQVSHLAVSPDGKLLAVATKSPDYTVNIWNLKTHKKVRSLGEHEGLISGLGFSPDGKFLAVADLRGSARLWRVGSWERPIRIDHSLAGFRALAFSPDGKWVVYCGLKVIGDRTQATLLVWDIKARTSREVAIPGKSRLSGIVFLPDGKEMITAGYDGLLRFWDPATLEQKRTFKVAEDLECLALSPDGKWLAIENAPLQPFAVYDVQRRKVGWNQKMLGYLTGMAFSPDSKLLVHVMGGSVSVWEADTGIFYRQFKPPKDGQNSVLAFTPEGKLITAGGEGILIWDPKFLEPLPRRSTSCP